MVALFVGLQIAGTFAGGIHYNKLKFHVNKLQFHITSVGSRTELQPAEIGAAMEISLRKKYFQKHFLHSTML